MKPPTTTPLVETDKLLAILDGRKLTKSEEKRTPENRLPRFENRVTGAAGGKKKAAIHILDAISYWTGNDARTFQQKLASLDADEIDVFINSPGGSVFEGVTIYNLLLAHPATINVHVLGLAASIASVIALAGDTVSIAENAMFMIHEPSVVAWGKAENLRRSAEVLDQITESLLNTYEARTNLNRDQIRAFMMEEKYFGADDSVKHGFATTKVSAVKAAALWDPADFESLPEAAKALAFKLDDETEPEKEPTGDAPSKPAEASAPEEPEEPEAVGTLEDVSAAEELLASIRAGLED